MKNSYKFKDVDLILNFKRNTITECKVNIDENQKMDLIELYRVNKMKHPIINGKKEIIIILVVKKIFQNFFKNKNKVKEEK